MLSVGGLRKSSHYITSRFWKGVGFGGSMVGGCMWAMGSPADNVYAAGQSDARGAEETNVTNAKGEQGTVASSDAVEEDGLADEALLFKEKYLEARAVALFKGIKCKVCSNRNLEEAEENIAVETRDFIRTLLRQGVDEDAVMQEVRTEYGEAMTAKTKSSTALGIVYTMAGVIAVGALILSLRSRKSKIPRKPKVDEIANEFDMGTMDLPMYTLHESRFLKSLTDPSTYMRKKRWISPVINKELSKRGQ